MSACKACFLLTVALFALPSLADATVVQILPLSGPLKPVGESARDTVAAYFKEAGQQNGAGKINLVTTDDAGNADRYLSEAKQQIDKQHPIALLGAIGAGGPLKLIDNQVLENAKIPLIGPISGTPALADNPNIYLVRASWRDEIQKLMRMMHSLGIKRVGVFYAPDPDGKFALFSAQQEANLVGLSVVSASAAPGDAVKLNAAAKYLLSESVDAIMMANTPATSGGFLKAYRGIGGGGQIFALSSVGSGQAMVDIAGTDAARGAGISQIMPFVYADSSPLVREYHAFAKRNNLRTGYIELEYYVAARVFVDSLRRAGRNPTGESLMKTLDATQDLGLGEYHISFTPDAHVGSKFVEMTVIGTDGHLER
ncbi:MAG: ABC transporter substrate-binding protein [Burkholderiales bacterium]|nr:ABC transporter substrate-binding protein [Burkholderiales bacterium]